MIGIGGIFGIVGSEKIDVKQIKQMLGELSKYGRQGYGVAWYSRDSCRVLKSLDLDEVTSLLSPDHGKVAIGVCRFGVYGRPAIPNTPPFYDCSKRFICVARGAIKGYPQIRRSIARRGHVLIGKDLSEIIVHSFEERVKNGVMPVDAIKRTREEFEGMFSALILDCKNGRLYCMCRGIPEYIGREKLGVIVCSEIDPLARLSNEVYRVVDGVVVVSGDKINVVEGEVRRIVDWREGRVLGGYDFYMQREMNEIPAVLKFQSFAQMDEYFEIAKRLIMQAKKVYMVGSGSSYNAVLYGAYVINELSDVSPIPQNATEFIYFMLRRVEAGDVLVANSQSGETSDVLRAVSKSRMRGAIVVGIINILGSPLMYASNVYLPIASGVENAIPATKTFVAQLSTFAKLAFKLSNSPDAKELGRFIYSLHEYAESVIDGCEVVIREYAMRVREFGNMFVLGRGVNFPIALEGALKLKEVAQIHAEGIDVGEFRHGTKTLLSMGFPVVVIVPQDLEAREDTYDLVKEVAGVSDVLIITDGGDPFAKRFSRYVVEVPKIPESLSPILNILPLQKLAFHLGVLKGKPIDSPPMLRKAVTLRN